MGIKWGYSVFRKLLTRSTEKNLKVKSLPYLTATQSGAINPATARQAWPCRRHIRYFGGTHIISSGADQNALQQEQILHDKRGRACGAQWLRCYRLSRHKLVQRVDRIIQRFLFPQSQFIIDWFHIVITGELV